MWFMYIFVHNRLHQSSFLSNIKTEFTAGIGICKCLNLYKISFAWRLAVGHSLEGNFLSLLLSIHNYQSVHSWNEFPVPVTYLWSYIFLSVMNATEKIARKHNLKCCIFSITIQHIWTKNKALGNYLQGYMVS
jgi:hypothetical protein